MIWHIISSTGAAWEFIQDIGSFVDNEHRHIVVSYLPAGKVIILSLELFTIAGMVVHRRLTSNLDPITRINDVL